MSKRQKKALKELKAKARLALDSPALVEIARSANSPNKAYEGAYLETGDANKAKACQYLAAVKRDYGKQEFDLFVPSVVSSRPRHKGPDKSKGEGPMSQKTEQAGNKTTTEESNILQIPLEGIEFRGVVTGPFAQVRAIQTYRNKAKKPVEAIYVFPLPDDATVTGCSMQIGRRTVKAELKKREQAKQEYHEAIEAGHNAALMEQERPNIFTMSTGGIEPGETVKVSLEYVLRVPWQNGGGRFKLPLVVAPRFIPGAPTGKTGNGWADDTDQVPDASRITPPVAKEGVPYTVKIKISFAPGFRCRLTSPSHSAMVEEQIVAKNQTVEITAEDVRPDCDFTLAYQSVSRVAEVAAHTFLSAENERFCLASIIPPGQAQPMASDIIFLFDRSGSMGGAKIDGLKKIGQGVADKLREQNLGHRVSIIAFDNDPEILSPLGDITDAAKQTIAGISPQGGTELGPALTKAYQQFPDSGRPRYILLITDGQTESVRYSGQNARIIIAGIDTAVNDTNLRDLAKASGGACEWFFPGEDFDRAINSLVGMLSGPVLQNINVDGGGEVVGLQDTFTNRPATIAIRWSKNAPASFTVKGKTPDGSEESWPIKISEAKECDFAHQLWAREFLRENPDKDKQTSTSLQYGIICQHTAFVAVSEKQVPGQKPVRVEIPVNLPRGWDYDAIFGQGQQPVSRRVAMVGAVHSFASYGLSPKGSMRSPSICRLTGPDPDDFDGPRGFAEVEEVLGFDSLEDHRLLGNDSLALDLPGPEEDLPDDQADKGFFAGLWEKAAALFASGFSFNKARPSIRVIGILSALDQHQREIAEKSFHGLSLTPKAIASWTPEQRAMTFYFAIRLSHYGLNFKKPVMEALAAKPPKSDRTANAWYSLAKKEQGFAQAIALPELTDNAYAYIAWKAGKEPRPVAAPWSVVP